MPNPPARYVKGAERRQLAKRARSLYDDGHTITEVAEQLGRSYGATRQLLLEVDTPIRRQGTHNRKAAR